MSRRLGRTPSVPLRLLMQDLVSFVRSQLPKPGEPWNGTEHHVICNQTAERFGLGITEFPVWLSRVVEGEIRDARENAEPSPNKRDRVEQDHNIGVLNRTRQAEDATGDEHEPQ